MAPDAAIGGGREGLGGGVEREPVCDQRVGDRRARGEDLGRDVHVASLAPAAVGEGVEHRHLFHPERHAGRRDGLPVHREHQHRDRRDG